MFSMTVYTSLVDFKKINTMECVLKAKDGIRDSKFSLNFQIAYLIRNLAMNLQAFDCIRQADFCFKQVTSTIVYKGQPVLVHAAKIYEGA
jgi:hypothetical protein